MEPEDRSSDRIVHALMCRYSIPISWPGQDAVVLALPSELLHASTILLYSTKFGQLEVANIDFLGSIPD